MGQNLQEKLFNQFESSETLYPSTAGSGGSRGDRMGLEFEAGSHQDKSFGLAEVPLAVLKVLKVAVRGIPMAASDADIADFDLDPSLALALQQPAIEHLNVVLAFRAKNAFGVFDLFHGMAPAAERRAGRASCA